MKKVGICFSKDLVGDKPLGHITTKLPVYIRLLEFMRKEGWEVYVLTRKTYQGGGVFAGGWHWDGKLFNLIFDHLKLDLVFDRTGGVYFPIENDSLVTVNNLDFKLLAWNKWATYKIIGDDMPQTLFLENENEIPAVLPKIKSDWVVLKPFNGLKGIGIFIGPKDDAVDFKFNEKYKQYVAQEFIDTSKGIAGIAPGKHDLRIVIINGKVVWCHVRCPVGESFLANAAQGGNLTEVDYTEVPEFIKNIVEKILKSFYAKYDNPIYSLDFGVGENGRPVIFEINDQIGFPKWDMKNRDKFLKELVINFKEKLASG